MESLLAMLDKPSMNQNIFFIAVTFCDYFLLILLHFVEFKKHANINVVTFSHTLFYQLNCLTFKPV